MNKIILNALVFVTVFIIFTPYLSKVIRLVNTTWEKRDYISKERKKEVFIYTPIYLIIGFFGVYFLVNALLNIIVF